MLKLLGLYQTLSPVSQHVLTSFTESAAPRAALLSTYILLWKHIDATRLAPLYFPRLAAVPASQYPEMDNIDSIFIDNAQRAEIDDFENLASSENLEVQYAALYALRKLADPETTSFLIKELDATDSLSQYTALATLAEMYKKGGDYGPAWDPFCKTKKNTFVCGRNGLRIRRLP